MERTKEQDAVAVASDFLNHNIERTVCRRSFNTGACNTPPFWIQSLPPHGLACAARINITPAVGILHRRRRAQWHAFHPVLAPPWRRADDMAPSLACDFKPSRRKAVLVI